MQNSIVSEIVSTLLSIFFLSLPTFLSLPLHSAASSRCSSVCAALGVGVAFLWCTALPSCTHIAQCSVLPLCSVLLLLHHAPTVALEELLSSLPLLPPALSSPQTASCLFAGEYRSAVVSFCLSMQLTSSLGLMYSICPVLSSLPLLSVDCPLPCCALPLLLSVVFVCTFGWMCVALLSILIFSFVSVSLVQPIATAQSPATVECLTRQWAVCWSFS